MLSTPSNYQLQIIYTKIDRSKDQTPHFTNYYFNVDSTHYFYPASTVKLPVSILALEKIHKLNIIGLSGETIMITDSAYACQASVRKDLTSENKLPSINNYIKRMFLISDNYAFARVHEFVGCDYLHETLEKWGYPNMRIVTKLDPSCSLDNSKVSNPIYFLDAQLRDTIYKQPLLFNKYNKPSPATNLALGRAYYNEKNKLVNGPMDFSALNFICLPDLHQILRNLVFNSFTKSYSISDDDWKLMMAHLGMYPRESQFPLYDSKIFYDSYKKYLMYGNAVANIRQDSLRIFNIVGRAYGFLIDCAYIVDFKNNVEFMVSSSMYLNEKNIVGSGDYQYNLLGMPFLKWLGERLYTYEKGRSKNTKPNLDRFKLFDQHN